MSGQIGTNENDDALLAQLELQLGLISVIDQMPIGAVVVHAPSGRLLKQNPAAEQLWHDAQLAPLVEHNYSRSGAIHPNGTSYDLNEYPIASALSGNTVRDREMRYVRTDGSWAFFCVNAAPLRDQNGTIIAAMATFTDVSAGKERECELRERYARAASLAHALELTQTIILGLDDVIQFWSEGAAQLYGYSAGEAVGKSAYALLRTVFPEPPETIRSSFQEHGYWNGELTHHRRDGEPVHVASHWVLYRSESSGAAHVIQVNNDLTVRRRIEQELRRSNEDLRQFARVVSHDLKAPVRMVRAYSELVLKRGYDRSREETREFLEYIYESAAGMEALITGLLDYAQAADPGVDTCRTVNLGEAVAKSCAGLAVSIRESGAVVTHSDLPLVRGYPVLFIQVFQNLISNAIKYARAGVPPRVEIGCERHASEWRVWVADNGIGIPLEQRERIFLPFKRLHGADIPGSGIGLATCKRAIERHGGRIWVEPQPEGGSKFIFTVPAAEVSSST